MCHVALDQSWLVLFRLVSVLNFNLFPLLIIAGNTSNFYCCYFDIHGGTLPVTVRSILGAPYIPNLKLRHL